MNSYEVCMRGIINEELLLHLRVENTKRGKRMESF